LQSPLERAGFFLDLNFLRRLERKSWLDSSACVAIHKWKPKQLHPKVPSTILIYRGGKH
jgi:hypothetical protein